MLLLLVMVLQNALPSTGLPLLLLLLTGSAHSGGVYVQRGKRETSTARAFAEFSR